MPRNPKCRYVNGEPAVTVYKPAGVPRNQLDSVEIGLDEVEALRLADREGLYQEAAAARMGISRPTFSRLIESARRKLAEALLEGKMIVFQGGPVVMGQVRTFECAACGERFCRPYGTGQPPACPACNSAEFRRVDDQRGRGRGLRRGRCGHGPDRGRGRCGRGGRSRRS
jgi:predicted DNA-binding protein (UPF0251 family)